MASIAQRIHNIPCEIFIDNGDGSTFDITVTMNGAIVSQCGFDTFQSAYSRAMEIMHSLAPRRAH